MNNPRLRRDSAAVWGGRPCRNTHSVPRRRTVARSAQSWLYCRRSYHFLGPAQGTAPASGRGHFDSVFWAIGAPLPLREGLGGGSSRGGLSLTPGKRSAARGGASVMYRTQRLEDARSTQCAVISLGCLAVDSSTMFMLRASRYRASSRHGVRVPA